MNVKYVKIMFILLYLILIFIIWSWQKLDTNVHELECNLAQKIKLIGKIPTRSQRILLRFIKSGLNSDINFNYESFDKGFTEYLMLGIAVIKKYLPSLDMDAKKLLTTSFQVLIHFNLNLSCFQLQCSCFEIGDFGIGYSDSLKKINHSCNPNLIAEYSQNFVTLLAIKDIQVGEQVICIVLIVDNNYLIILVNDIVYI